MHIGLGDECQAVLRVDPRGLEQLLAERAAELRHLSVKAHARQREQRVAGERVAVRVQAARGHGDDDVAGLNTLGAEDRVGFDDADAGAGQVVLARLQHAGMLGDLAADERATGERATVGDPAHDVGHPLRDDLAARHVIVHEERLGAAHDQVVHHHADQVEADRVVLVERLRDHQLGADAIGGRRENRRLVAREVEREQAGEAAEVAHHLRRRARDTRLLSSATARSPASMSTPAAL